MTLVELLAGMVVAGAAIAGGYGALAAVLDQRDRVEAAIAATVRGAAERRTLAAWISGARLTADDRAIQFRGMDGYFDDLPDDELSLLTTTPTPASDGETVVRLYVDRDSLTSERGLVAELSAAGSATAERIEIEAAAAGLEARYLTRMLGRAEWLPSWISSTLLPLAVELTVVPAPGDSLPGPLRLPILVPVRTAR
jgi:hypothetical protein